MKYQTVRVNEYAQLDIVPFESISKIAFEKLADPVERLEDYYKRKETKPNIMTNGGLFNMQSGHNVMSFVCGGVEQNYKNGFTGMGVTHGIENKLVYGKDNAYPWNYFMTGYPMLVIDSKVNKDYGNAKNLNFKTSRTAIGVKQDGTLLILIVDMPGMTFEEMSNIFLRYHAKYAMNLDGGGSTRKLHDGKCVNNPTGNRAVDNAFCVYLKQDPLAVYEDEEQIADWTRSAVAYCFQNGIMKGDSNGKFRPNDSVSRQEMAVIAERVMNLCSGNLATAVADLSM